MLNLALALGNVVHAQKQGIAPPIILVNVQPHKELLYKVKLVY